MNDRLASLYPAHLQTVVQRHDAALAATGFDAVIIAGGAIHVAFLDDALYPFKVNPHLKYWVPVIDNPNCFLIHTPGQKPRLLFFQPIDYWYKPADTPSAHWIDFYDIEILRQPADASQFFPKQGKVAFIGEPGGAQTGDINPAPLLDRLHFDRSWKTDYEIECMYRANVNGVKGHRAAETAFREGLSEYEIHLAYLRGSDQTEEELPYNNIIALNDHASVLHYVQHERRTLGAADTHSFLIDAGATTNGYASDITRTYSRDGGEFGELIAAMDRMQRGLCEAVRPGVNYPDIHHNAHRGVASILSDFRFVKLPAEAIVERGISSTFLPHGVGHFIGLQVHDVAGFMADASGCTIPKPEGHPYLRLTRPIEARMVFTIEPGLYFIESLLGQLREGVHAKDVDWNKVDDFRKFGGIRIEDDVVVTESGHRNLTREAFAGSRA